MHRKSMEAAQTLGHDMIERQKPGYDKEEDEESRSSSDTDTEEPERKPKIAVDEKDDFRSNSIAALRAKAQEHSAKMFGGGFDPRDKMFSLHGAGGEYETHFCSLFPVDTFKTNLSDLIFASLSRST